MPSQPKSSRQLAAYKASLQHKRPGHLAGVHLLCSSLRCPACVLKLARHSFQTPPCTTGCCQGQMSLFCAEPLNADVAEVALLEGGASNQASMLDSAHDIRKGAPPGRQPGSPVQAGAGSGEKELIFTFKLLLQLQRGAAPSSLHVHSLWLAAEGGGLCACAGGASNAACCKGCASARALSAACSACTLSRHLPEQLSGTHLHLQACLVRPLRPAQVASRQPVNGPPSFMRRQRQSQRSSRRPLSRAPPHTSQLQSGSRRRPGPRRDAWCPSGAGG